MRDADGVCVQQQVAFQPGHGNRRKLEWENSCGHFFLVEYARSEIACEEILLATAIVMSLLAELPTSPSCGSRLVSIGTSSSLPRCFRHRDHITVQIRTRARDSPRSKSWWGLCDLGGPVRTLQGPLRAARGVRLLQVSDVVE